MIGFTYNGTHSKTYGIVAKSVNRPILPELRKRELTVPGQHGVYDFSDNVFESRLIEVELRYVGSSLTNLRTNAHSIAAWLSGFNGAKNLVFDDETDKYYTAKIYSEVGLQNLFLVGECSVIFECKPFAYAVTQATASFSVTADVTATLTTSGTFGVRPDINISGSFTTLSITINSASLTYGEAVTGTQTLTISNENFTVLLGTANKTNVVSGDITTFLEIPVGGSTVIMSGTGLNCNVHFTYNDRYL